MDRAARLVLPQRTLLVLCGLAGSGKSTFARTFIEEHATQGLRETSVVSSDYCRALVCDDETNQRVSRDAYDLLYYITQKRLLQDRFTIVDNTALQAYTRHKLLAMGQHLGYTTCLLVFDVPAQLCLQRDQERSRIVGAEVILYHARLMSQALQDIPNEGWQQVYVFDGEGRPDLTIA